MQPHGLLEAALYTHDLRTAETFYTTVLGLEVISRHEGRSIFFRLGPSILLLFDPRATTQPTSKVKGKLIPTHGATGPGHVAFRVHTAELPAWRERLHQRAIAIEQEIAWPQGGHSIYFRDPAGNSLELATPALWSLPEIMSNS